MKIKNKLFILVSIFVAISLSGCNGQSKEDKIFGSNQSTFQPYKPISLFGMELKGATHEQFQKHLIKMGAKYLRSESFSESQVDYYNPKEIFSNALTMEVKYAKANNKFKQIAFYFPVSNSFFLLNLITSRYGAPDKSEIDKDSNHVFALWIHKDVTLRIDNTLGSVAELSFYDLHNEEPPPEQTNRKQESLVELFGIKLDSAKREELRNAFVNAGMQPVQFGKNAWLDVYNAEKVLSGASRFEAAYTSDNRFAACEYTMPSHMDRYQINGVINIISEKYGMPNYFDGNVEIGSVKAEWHMGNIKIIVSRDWPDTTTYLEYINSDNYDQFNKEVNAHKLKALKNIREQNNNAI